MSPEFEDFVPDLSLADPLLAELGRNRTAEAARCALIGVAGRAVLRKSWSDEVEVSERIFAELRASPEPVPSLEVIGTRSHRALAPDSSDATPKRCSECWQKLGLIPCAACGGDGKISVGEGYLDCRGCGGAGRITCPICDGSGKSVKVTIRYADDRTTAFAHVFAPELPPSLVVGLAQFIKQRQSIPEALSFNLFDEQDRVDAYRGRRGAEEYRGHRLGSAIARARQYVERVRRSPSVVASSHGATAWPFALLELQGGGVAALVLDERRNGQVVFG